MKMETSEIIFIVGILVFPAVSFIVATWLMFVVTKRLANVSHGGKRWLKAIKRTALSALLVMFCSFNGCVASFYSGYVTVAKDYTTEETVGITSFQGFPIWYDQCAPHTRAWTGLILNRIYANWCVWTTVFMLICCRLYFVKTRYRYVLPAGIILGTGCVGVVTFLLLLEFKDPTIHNQTKVLYKMAQITNAVNIYKSKHNGEFSTSLEELTKLTKDGKPPLLRKQHLKDPWGKRIKYEHKKGRLTLRSSGPDRKMGTEDDITNYALDYELRCVRHTMEAITYAVTSYAQRYNGEFPSSLDELVYPSEGNPSLMHKTNLTDPWGKPIEHERTENGFTIRSSGPDRIMGTEDDIIKHVTNDVRQGEKK